MQIHVEEPEMINYTGKVGMFNVEIGVPLVHLALRQQSIFYYMMFCVIRKKSKNRIPPLFTFTFHKQILAFSARTHLISYN